MKVNYLNWTIAPLFLTMACADTGFRGTQPGQAAKEKTVKETQGKGASPQLSERHEQIDSIASGNQGQDPQSTIKDVDGRICSPKNMHLDVAFVLDITGSMSRSISNIRSNIEAFALKAQDMTYQNSDQKPLSVSIGLLGYADAATDDHLIAMSQDFSRFANQAGIIRTRGGGDLAEGGLGAVDRMLAHVKSYRQQQADVQSMVAMIVITDNYAHTGSGSRGNRNFSSDPLIQQLQDPFWNHFVLLDVAPTRRVNSGPYPETVSYTPAEQWQKLRQGWNQSRPQQSHEIGKSLGFKFNAELLTQELPALIQEHLVLCD